MFSQARVLVKTKKIDDAIALLRGAAKNTQSRQDHGLALLYAGILAYKAKNYNDARTNLLQALQLPLRLKDYARYYLALCDLRLGDLTAARYDLNRIHNTPAALAFDFEIRYELANIAIQQKGWGRAESQFTSIAAENAAWKSPVSGSAL